MQERRSTFVSGTSDVGVSMKLCNVGLPTSGTSVQLCNVGLPTSGTSVPDISSGMVTVDRLALGRPEVGQFHLMPFLLPTMFCDCDCESIVALSRDLVPPGGHASGWMRTARMLSDTRTNSLPGTSAENAARRVRSWVRRCAQIKSHPKSLNCTQSHSKKVPRVAADVQRPTEKSPTRWT